MRTILPIMMLLATSACAGQSALRSTSAQTAVILDKYRSGFRAFAVGQSDLNNQIEARIGRLQSMRAQGEGETKVRNLAWALADDKKAQQEFALLSEMRAEAFLAPGTILGPPATSSTDPAPPKLAFDAGAIDAVIKQLVELQKPRSSVDLVGDLLAFGTATYDAAVKAAKEKADEEAKATEAATDKVVTSDGNAAAPGNSS